MKNTEYSVLYIRLTKKQQRALGQNDALKHSKPMNPFPDRQKSLLCAKPSSDPTYQLYTTSASHFSQDTNLAKCLAYPITCVPHRNVSYSFLVSIACQLIS